MTSMERWHIGKTITFGNLLTGFAAIGAIAVFLFDQNSRITALETRADATDVSVAAVHTDVKTMSRDIISKLDVISSRQYYHLEGHSPPTDSSASSGGSNSSAGGS